MQTEAYGPGYELGKYANNNIFRFGIQYIAILT